LNLRLEVIGDGRRKPELEALAERLGIRERVAFLGHLPAGDEVRKALDRANVFVLPSRQEGLPRAMLEAMARGLPCIGSTIGGIPELLDQEDLVPPANSVRLAALIEAVVTDPGRMEAMAERCFAKAQEYREDVLRARRKEFLCFVRQETEKWLASARAARRRIAV
jgi:glycosyltransferase involved in cell wall biosynthesis